MTLDEEIKACEGYIRILEQEIAERNRNISAERRKIWDLKQEISEIKQ